MPDPFDFVGWGNPRASPDAEEVAFASAQERFLVAADLALDAGERHFADVRDEAAAARYEAALEAQRQAARHLEQASGAFFRSRRA